MILAVVGLTAATSICAQRIDENSQSSDVRAAPCVIFGAVHFPARLELHRPVKLFEGISIIGGVTDTANGIIRVIHTERGPDQNSEDVYKLSAIKRDESNAYLAPGDIVIVEEWEPVYVTGNVAKPGEILKGGITLTGAIELAGGVTSDPENTKVVIYRLENGVVRKIGVPVNLAAIKRLRVSDLILKPYDIVDVGGTGQLTPPFPYSIADPIGLNFTNYVIN